MASAGLKDKKNFRLRPEDYDAIERIVSHNKDIYENPSHFIRSWVRRGIRHYRAPAREKDGGGA